MLTKVFTIECWEQARAGYAWIDYWRSFRRHFWPRDRFNEHAFHSDILHQKYKGSSVGRQKTSSL